MRKSRGFIALSLVMVAIAGGCGDGDGTKTAVGSDEQGGSYRQGTYYPKGPSSEFVIPGGDNTIQYFGREGTDAEREDASAVVEAWEQARSTKNWRKDCRYLSRSYSDIVVTDAENVSKGEATTCVESLAFFGPIASGDFGNTMTGSIDSLRVSQGTAYAQYHGKQGIDWIVPLKREGGEWKVEVTAPVKRGK